MESMLNNGPFSLSGFQCYADSIPMIKNYILCCNLQSCFANLEVNNNESGTLMYDAALIMNRTMELQMITATILFCKQVALFPSATAVLPCVIGAQARAPMC